MYRQEKVINGILSYRNTPKGIWIPYSAELLTAKLQKLREAIEVYKEFKIRLEREIARTALLEKHFKEYKDMVKEFVDSREEAPIDNNKNLKVDLINLINTYL